jgi:predicted DNA-binding antitoxin AbrB/MazE fold protein
VKGTVEAVFQDGVFRPVQSPGLSDGDRVRLTIERVPHATPDEVLKLARQVYEGLSRADIEEIEEMARHRPMFLGARSRL